MPFPDMDPGRVADYVSPARAPDDFDAFWAATLAEARVHPLDLNLEPVEAGPVFDVSDLSFCGFGGHRVKGWLIAPRGGARDLVVKFIGYNGGRSFAHEHLFWPATGRAVLVMDTRGQGSGWAPGATPDPVGSDPAHAGFMTKGILRREEYFYRRVFTDAVRAVVSPTQTALVMVFHLGRRMVWLAVLRTSAIVRIGLNSTRLRMNSPEVSSGAST